MGVRRTFEKRDRNRSNRDEPRHAGASRPT